MLKRVLAANSSWCREGPRINLGHGLARTNESRAWPGVAILIRRGGQRPWDLGRLRVERRAAWWLPSGTCRAGGCVWREVQRVLDGACGGLQRQMRQVRRGDLELRTGDSERGPGRSFHQRVAPGPPCEAGDPIALRLAAELLEEAGRTNEAAQLRQYGLEPASRIATRYDLKLWTALLRESATYPPA